MKILIFILSLGLAIFSIDCNKTVVTEPVSKSSVEGGLSLKIDKTEVPAGVIEILASLTRQGYETKSAELNLIADNIGEVNIDSVDSGTWHLTVSAEDSSGQVLYSGETDVDVIAGETAEVYLTLKPITGVTGNIYIHVSWGSGYTQFNYTFDNNSDLYPWNGNAYGNIVNNEFEISSTNGYLWRFIDNYTTFSQGEIDADVYVEDSSFFSIQTKGPLADSNEINTFGSLLQFSRDSLFNSILVNGKPAISYTGYTYKPNQWYSVIIKFDCNAGSLGQYDLWVKPRYSNAQPTYVGKFDFRNGKLLGINLLVLGIGDPHLTQTKSARIDNMYLNLKE